MSMLVILHGVVVDALQPFGNGPILDVTWRGFVHWNDSTVPFSV